VIRTKGMIIESCNSTNTLLKELLAKGEWPEGERFIRADYQTAGRGQTGNGWESEKGKNLLCSILIDRQPSLISHQFYLNVAVSAAVCKIAKLFGGDEVSIKWPNDIYWKDKKLAGILIENAIIGNELKYSIVGIGLNVNQTEWHSGAPNPVSLKQISGKDENIDGPMTALVQTLQEVLAQPQEEVWKYYRTHLYRSEGYWPFVEREVSIAPTMNANGGADAFLARIANILPTGEIVLEDQNGKQRIYHFKQVRYVVK